MTIRIRPMTRVNLRTALDWAAVEGWNPGLGDAECFFAADPSGFFMARDGDTPVGSISMVKYGESFAFLGLYIVVPGYRGRGIGLRLWHRALESADDRTVGLDGVVAQQSNYRESGFNFAHRNIRYEGKTSGDSGTFPGLCPLGEVPRDKILAYDRRVFPADRPDFWEAWISRPGTVAVVDRPGKEIRGLGVIRPCRSGYKIGPLYADTAEGANRIFRCLCASVSVGSPVFLDVPEPNKAAVQLAKGKGMRPVFETARMYRGAAPDPAMSCWFGVTSFELG